MTDINVSALHFDHKLGLFGDHENKSNPLKISEVKDLTIVQIAKFKKSQINIDQIKINNLSLPKNYPEALHFVITKVNHQITNNVWETQLDTISMPVTSNTSQPGVRIEWPMDCEQSN